MKVSIITVTYNSSVYISDCINSVHNQTYNNIEHIIIDGASKDNTLEIVKSIPNRVVNIISEPDKGIYDAMNKGIKLATGDVIGILNSDDFLSSDTIIEEIVETFNWKAIDAIYGDIKFVNPSNIAKTIRYYSSRLFKPWLFRFGMMPPHASFYAKQECFDKLGFYKTDYRIAADLDLLIRFVFKNKIKTAYFGKVVVTMRIGGLSTSSLKSKFLLNKESIRACKENGLYTNYLFLLVKYLIKTIELIFFRNKKK